jgi:alpha-tubulin suppressor-like RCC1 family protein
MGANLPFVNLGTGRKALEIRAGGVTTCALLDNHALKCWGSNDSGELGLGDKKSRGDTRGSMGDALPAVNLGRNRTVTSFSVGIGHSCAILDNHALKCWGDNQTAELGLGTKVAFVGTAPTDLGDHLPAVNLGTGRYAVQVAASADHTCAILDNGSVKCWGRNDFGQLGLGNTQTYGFEATEMGDFLPALDLGTSLHPVQIFAEAHDTCAQFEDGSLKCWGTNDFGVLGSDDGNRGASPGQMGTSLPFVNVEAGLPVVHASCAYEHCCVSFINGAVKCWGSNNTGELGIQDQGDRGTSADQMGVNLPFIDLGNFQSAVQLGIGDSHTCVVLTTGSVKCWGDNEEGELGLGSTVDHLGDAPGQMGDALPVLQLL